MTRASHGSALKRAEQQAKARNQRRRLSLDQARRLEHEDEIRRAWENQARLRAESKIAREQLGDAA